MAVLANRENIVVGFKKIEKFQKPYTNFGIIGRPKI
jgi:hypothetical protein